MKKGFLFFILVVILIGGFLLTLSMIRANTNHDTATVLLEVGKKYFLRDGESLFVTENLMFEYENTAKKLQNSLIVYTDQWSLVGIMHKTTKELTKISNLSKEKIQKVRLLLKKRDELLSQIAKRNKDINNRLKEKIFLLKVTAIVQSKLKISPAYFYSSTEKTAFINMGNHKFGYLGIDKKGVLGLRYLGEF